MVDCYLHDAVSFHYYELCLTGMADIERSNAGIQNVCHISQN